MSARFTIDGSETLERRLGALCEEVRRGVLAFIPQRSLRALVLGGGYGRGEGGVLATPTGDHPYNDLEFYILVRGSELVASRRYGRRIHELAEHLTHQEGIEIELKLLSMRKLQRNEVTMFYYDLVSGHRLIHGDEGWLTQCEHHRAAHRIPLHEATRLLMNRCSGLLFAQERLSRNPIMPEDADFVGRNLAKAKLAFGDVVLTMRSQYHWSCRERHKRLKKLAAEKQGENLTSLTLLHEQGVDFKLHPVRTEKSASELRAELEFLRETGLELWLKLESRRLGRTFCSLEDYVGDSGKKCPETRPLKNCLINARTYGLGEIANSHYPRERLLRSLPLLLWAPTTERSAQIVRAELRTGSAQWNDLVRAYEGTWRIFN